MKHPTVKMTPDTPTPRTARDVLTDSTDLYERKDADYGQAWKLVGKTLALWLDELGEDELVVPADDVHLSSLGLFTRRLDKMIREWNGWYCTDELRVDENIAETHADDVPYAAMHTELAEQSTLEDFERPTERHRAVGYEVTD